MWTISAIPRSCTIFSQWLSHSVPELSCLASWLSACAAMAFARKPCWRQWACCYCGPARAHPAPAGVDLPALGDCGERGCRNSSELHDPGRIFSERNRRPGERRLEYPAYRRSIYPSVRDRRSSLISGAALAGIIRLLLIRPPSPSSCVSRLWRVSWFVSSEFLALQRSRISSEAAST